MPAKGRLRPAPAIPTGQVPAEQRDGPLLVAIAPLHRRSLQRGEQHGQESLVPGGDMGMTAAIAQGLRSRRAEISVQPVVDGLSRGAQLGSDRGHRGALIELQDCQGPAEDIRVVGRVAGLTQSESLFCCQVEIHGPSPSRRGEREWSRPFHDSWLKCPSRGEADG
jgi:hypothetical protein